MTVLVVSGAEAAAIAATLRKEPDALMTRSRPAPDRDQLIAVRWWRSESRISVRTLIYSADMRHLMLMRADADAAGGDEGDLQA